MKIIDFHMHAGDFSLLREDIQELLTRKPFDEGYGINDVFSNPSKLVEYVENLNSQRAVIFAECGPGTNFSIDGELIVNFCSKEKKLIPFGNINPNHHNVPEEFEKNIRLGVKGFKFYPADHGFDPYTDEMMSVYKQCATLNKPIVFHTGLTAQRNTEQKFIQPNEYVRLVETFPDLTLIMAHTGNPTWNDEALELVSTYDNLYTDTGLVPVSKWNEIYSHRPNAENKILFGSDFPVCGSYSVLIKSIVELDIDVELKNKIMFANADRLLKKLNI